MRNNQVNWLIAGGVVVLLTTAVVTLRAAEHSTQYAVASAAPDGGAFTNAGVRAGSATSPGATHGAAVAPAGAGKQHPPASAPEESATIADDPTTAPDPSQSADNNVSFPTDI